MSDLPLSPSASGTSPSSYDSSASTGSSTPLTLGLLYPLPEADEDGPIDRHVSPVPDLGGRLSPCYLGGEPNEADVGLPTKFDDIMLLFKIDEADAEGGEAGEASRWLLVDVDSGQIDGKKWDVDDECQLVVEGEFFELREREVAKVGQPLVEGLEMGVGPNYWAVDCQVGAREREGSEGSEAEQRKVGEAEEREEGQTEEGKTEEREEVEAEKREKGEAEESEIEDREESETEESEVCTRAIVLAKSLGLGSSSDSEEDDAVDHLAILTDERQLGVVGESSYRVGECESEGLTEEVGAVRGQNFDPGMLDEKWCQKTLALNREEIANSIYHVPKGYRLHLPPKGTSIHHPPDGHVGVYLKDLEFGLRFPLVDVIAQIINQMGLSLGQLTPQSIRVIVAYV